MKPKKFKYHIKGRRKLTKEQAHQAMLKMAASCRQLPSMKELGEIKRD